MPSPDASRFGALPSATGGIARLAYARLQAATIETESLLRKVGLTPHQIEDPGIRLKVQDQIRFLNLAASALSDDLLGFQLAQVPDIRELGLLYYVSASSETLAEALQRSTRYSSIVNEGISLKYIEGAEICLRFAYVGVGRHLDQHQIEFWMAALVRMCRQLTGLRIVPVRVRLAHHRNIARAEFAEFFGSDVEFGATADEIAFAISIKQMTIAGADPYLGKILIAYCEEALANRPKHSGSFRSVVENAIVPLLPHGKANVGEIARRLGVSQRTFARRLSLEGLTFSGILETLRSDLAQRYLTDKGLSISQIAWLLGYREVSALSHAFKRWTGETLRGARSKSFS